MTAKPVIVYALGIFLGFGLVSCNTTTPDVHVERALNSYEEHDLGAATVEVENALRKSPDHVAARILLGDIYLETGDYASALHEFGCRGGAASFSTTRQTSKIAYIELRNMAASAGKNVVDDYLKGKDEQGVYIFAYGYRCDLR